MKPLLIISIILIPILTWGQSGDLSDSIDYRLDEYHKKYPEQLGKPDLDSLSLEIRYWISGHYFSGLFIKLSKSQKGEWNYTRGYIDYIKDKVVIIPTLPTPPDLDSLWQILQSKDILKLPDQKNARIAFVNGGKENPLNEAQKQKVIEMVRGDLYIIETFDSSGYRQYGYVAPEKVDSMLTSNGLRSDEHKMMNEIVSLLNRTFSVKDLVIAKFMSMKNNENDR